MNKVQPLQPLLHEIKEEFMADGWTKLKKEHQNAMIKQSKELAKSDILSKASKEGDILPDITLTNLAGKKIRVRELTKDGPIVLVFYRGQWCPYCNMQLRHLGKNMHIIKHAADLYSEFGAKIVAVSAQTPSVSKEMVESCQLPFDVLCDMDFELAKSMNLVYELIPEMHDTLSNGLHVDFNQYYDKNHKWRLPVTATYIVRKGGIIQKAFIDLDYSNRAEIADIIEALASLEKEREKRVSSFLSCFSV